MRGPAGRRVEALADQVLERGAVEVAPGQAVAVVVDEPDVLDARAGTSRGGDRSYRSAGIRRQREELAPDILRPMDVRAVARAAEGRRDAFTESLRDLVDVDSGTYTPEGVNKV